MKVDVIIDRPLGSRHSKTNTLYELNYGYVKNIYAFDEEEQDVYIIDEDKPLSEYNGYVVGIIRRVNDLEDKWVVSKILKKYSIDEIRAKTNFMEKYFESIIIIK